MKLDILEDNRSNIMYNSGCQKDETESKYIPCIVDALFIEKQRNPSLFLSFRCLRSLFFQA